MSTKKIKMGRSDAKKIFFIASGLIAVVAIYAFYRTFAADYVAGQKFVENFSLNTTVDEKASPGQSLNPYWWVKSGGQMAVNGGAGKTFQGSIPRRSFWQKRYSSLNPIDTKNGYLPQNVFSVLTRTSWQNGDYQAYFKQNNFNAVSSPNRNIDSGLALLARYSDDNNYYRGAFTLDGSLVISKKVNGTSYTLSRNTYFTGTYNGANNLIPKGYWYGLKLKIENINNTVRIGIYADKSGGSWELINEIVDDGSLGAPLLGSGYAGIKTDFMDVEFDGFQIVVPGVLPPANQTTTTVAPTTTTTTPPNVTSFNVVSYGAKSGDGLDDTAAFNATISASINKGQVYVPAGTYHVQNVSVPAAANILMDNLSTLSYNGAFGGHVMKVSGNGVRLTGGILDAKLQGGGLYARGSDIGVTGTTVLNSFGKVGIPDNFNAIDFVGSNSTFDRVTARNSWEGIVIGSYSTGVTVKNSYFNGMVREGILVYGHSNNVRIEDCTIENFGTGDIFRGGIHFYGATNVYAYRNKILGGGVDSNGIRLRDTNTFDIQYNNIFNVGESGIGVVQQNDWGITSGNGTIANNTIEKTGLRGIGHPYTSLAPISVLNNVIKNIYYNPATTQTIDSADCIIVLQPGSVVTGNKVENCGGYGVRVGTGVTVSGNTQVAVGK